MTPDGASALPAVVRVRIDTAVDIDPAAWREMQGEDFTGLHRSEIQELVTDTVKQQLFDAGVLA